MAAIDRIKRAYLELIGRPRPVLELPLALKSLARLISSNNIDLVIDVGANVGQFGARLRELGYRGKIVSFEPLSYAFTKLKQRAADDKNWDVYHLGLGDQSGELVLNIAGNVKSSSILPMLPAHEAAAPQSRYRSTETITVKRLDDLFEDICEGSSRIFLKLDVQGYERNVLEGAGRSIARIGLIQTELSTLELYEGSGTYQRYFDFFARQGYRLVWLEPSFWNGENGELLQFDAVFSR